MKTYKKIMHLVPLLLFWLMMTVFFWSWIFTFLTDAPREEKMVLFIECDVPKGTSIAEKLECLPSENISLVQVKPFSYSMMSSEDIRNSDLYIVSESGFEEYSEWFRPLPEKAEGLGEIFLYDSVPYGIKVYDFETQTGLLSDCIDYEGQNYYLVFGNNSVHTENGEAVSYAAYLLTLH